MKKRTIKNIAACLAAALVQAALFLPALSGCTAVEDTQIPPQDTADAAPGGAEDDTRRAMLECLYADSMREEGFARAAEPDARCADAPCVLVPHYGNAMFLACNALSGIEREIGLIVLVGPNHSGEGGAVQVSGADWYWDSGRTSGDAEIAGAIAKACEGTLTDAQIAQDWSVQTLVPYAHRYFPQARIVTVLLARGAALSQLAALSAAVGALSGEEGTLLLGSADFSHYLAPRDAQEKDARTQELIEAEDIAEILTLDNGHIDSPETLAVVMLYAQAKGAKLQKLGGLFERFMENGREKAGSYYAYAAVAQ